MHLIFGGAYQGKLDYAKKKYDLSEKDVFVCGKEHTEIDFSKRVIYGIEDFTWACVVHGIEARQYFEDNFPEDTLAQSESILICTDISQGVVPTDALQRAWREMTGRLMAYLSGEAESVTRIFCGLPQGIK